MNLMINNRMSLYNEIKIIILTKLFVIREYIQAIIIFHEFSIKLLANFFIIFYLSLSAVNFYLLLKNTQIVNTISKMPFIGFKLAIVLVLLILGSGLPILYMPYKMVIVARDAYLRQS